MSRIPVEFMDHLAFYSKPGIMTDPGKYSYLFEGLPDDLAALCSVIQNNMIHVFWAERMGINLTEIQKNTLEIRSVSGKLARIAEKGNQSLTTPRSIEQRQVGNCRDFTTFLVSVLRYKGIPARARCGFGVYFEPDLFIDHWVGEYWNALQRRWMMVDSQLDSFQLNALNIKFNPLDVPPDAFITAGKAWRMCRKDKVDPNKFGILDMHGLRFIWGNVIRDFLALNKVEILPWDGGWGFLNQKLTDPLPDYATLNLYDRIAALTLDINEKFPEIRVYYENEPRFHIPPKFI